MSKVGVNGHAGSLADITQFVEIFRSMPGFAITKTQFRYLLLTKGSEKVTSDEVFEFLDRNHDDRIDGLEFIAALTCVNRASFEEKAHCKLPMCTLLYSLCHESSRIQLFRL